MRKTASPGFHRRPRLAARWPGSHPRLDRRFRLSAPHAVALWSTRTARSREQPLDDFPDDLGLTHRSHLVPVASAASKLSSPRESVRTARRFRGRTAADALLGFASPELCSGRASDPLMTQRTIPSAAG
jgi:hypothetical protein